MFVRMPTPLVVSGTKMSACPSPSMSAIVGAPGKRRKTVVGVSLEASVAGSRVSTVPSLALKIQKTDWPE